MASLAFKQTYIKYFHTLLILSDISLTRVSNAGFTSVWPFKKQNTSALTAKQKKIVISCVE